MDVMLVAVAVIVVIVTFAKLGKKRNRPMKQRIRGKYRSELPRREEDRVIQTIIQSTEPAEEPREKIAKRYDYRKKPLLHQEEQAIFGLLVESLQEFLVMSQVRLADIVQPDWSKVKGEFDKNQARKKVMPKSVDFVICDREFNVVLCIEFDGRHHEKPEQIELDREKDHALKSAGIDIWRWKPNAIPTKAEIRQRVGLNH